MGSALFAQLLNIPTWFNWEIICSNQKTNIEIVCWCFSPRIFYISSNVSWFAYISTYITILSFLLPLNTASRHCALAPMCIYIKFSKTDPGDRTEEPRKLSTHKCSHIAVKYPTELDIFAGSIVCFFIFFYSWTGWICKSKNPFAYFIWNQSAGSESHASQKTKHIIFLTPYSSDFLSFIRLEKKRHTLELTEPWRHDTLHNTRNEEEEAVFGVNWN